MRCGQRCPGCRARGLGQESWGLLPGHGHLKHSGPTHPGRAAGYVGEALLSQGFADSDSLL